MFLRISSRSDASRLKQSAAVVAQISGLYFTIHPFCPVNPGFLLYSELAASFSFPGRLPAEQVHLVNRAGSHIVLVRRLLPQLLSKVNRAQLNELQTNLTLAVVAAAVAAG